MPLVSIVVPVYKVEKYLDECVQSIVNQTLADIEIILVNDGSPDNCPQMCDGWAKKDSRIKVIHQENGGLAVARNAGIKTATSKYIAFVDSDDWIDEQMIKTLYCTISNYSAEIVQCGVEIFHENGCIKTYGNDQEKIFNTGETFVRVVKPYVEDNFYLDGISSYRWNKIYAKSLLDKCIPLCNINLTMREDALLNLWAYCFCNKKIELKENYLYHYRQLENSMSHKFDEKLYEQQNLYFEEVYKIAKKFNLKTKGIEIRSDYALCGFIQILISTDIKVLYKANLLKKYYQLFLNHDIISDYSKNVDRPFSCVLIMFKLKLFFIVALGTQIVLKLRRLKCH